MGKTTYLVKIKSPEEITGMHEYLLSEHLRCSPVPNTKTRRTRVYRIKAWPYELDGIQAELTQNIAYKVTFTEEN